MFHYIRALSAYYWVQCVIKNAARNGNR